MWGVGFNGDRDSLDECAALFRFLRDNPEFGGTIIMAGVPFGWRTLDRDAAKDTRLHEVLQLCGIISPWAVGRYGTGQSKARVATSPKFTKPTPRGARSTRKTTCP